MVYLAAYTLVSSNLQVPSLVGAGIWGGIATLMADYWPVVALALALILFPALIYMAVKLIKHGASSMG